MLGSAYAERESQHKIFVEKGGRVSSPEEILENIKQNRRYYEEGHISRETARSDLETHIKDMRNLKEHLDSTTGDEALSDVQKEKNCTYKIQLDEFFREAEVFSGILADLSEKKIKNKRIQAILNGDSARNIKGHLPRDIESYQNGYISLKHINDKLKDFLSEYPDSTRLQNAVEEASEKLQNENNAKKALENRVKWIKEQIELTISNYNDNGIKLEAMRSKVLQYMEELPELIPVIMEKFKSLASSDKLMDIKSALQKIYSKALSKKVVSDAKSLKVKSVDKFNRLVEDTWITTLAEHNKKTIPSSCVSGNFAELLKYIQKNLRHRYSPGIFRSLTSAQQDAAERFLIQINKLCTGINDDVASIKAAFAKLKALVFACDIKKPDKTSRFFRCMATIADAVKQYDNHITVNPNCISFIDEPEVSCCLPWFKK